MTACVHAARGREPGLKGQPTRGNSTHSCTGSIYRAFCIRYDPTKPSVNYDRSGLTTITTTPPPPPSCRMDPPRGRRVDIPLSIRVHTWKQRCTIFRLIGCDRIETIGVAFVRTKLCSGLRCCSTCLFFKVFRIK